MVYSLALAESASPVELSCSNLLLMALLIGNDYKKVRAKQPLTDSSLMKCQRGLKGCGISLTCRIAQTGLGKELFEAIQMGSSEAGLQPFLQPW